MSTSSSIRYSCFCAPVIARARFGCLALLLLFNPAAHALDAAGLSKLATGDTTAKLEAINAWVAANDLQALPVLQALVDGDLQLSGTQVLIVKDGAARDALTQQAATAAADAEKISINNRVRRVLNTALASLKLRAPDRATRLRAALDLQDDADAELLPLLATALQSEADAEVTAVLRTVQARLQLADADPQIRINAARTLSQATHAADRAALQARLAKDADGNYAESDQAVRTELQKALERMNTRFQFAETLGHVFSGLSLGSILLLAALGLAITFGLMGIINMAHGELLMIGAYATYGVQTLFRHYLPEWIDAYLLVAVPAAFIAAMAVGMVMERSVIRHLYGRPLETLLATWGISLLLIQTVRLSFGATNVEVANPSWMSGAFSPMPGLVLPYNRIAIIAFAAVVLLLVWLILNRSRLGLYVRAVTQNRRMADCLGVPTPRVDVLAFGIGSGIAGLGGVALSQIGNVGPELGQAYIVDSFMVVVLGGVGQLIGTVIAALGLGEINKLLEPYAGAVLGKIFVLVLVIIFIQRRPQGLFALKGRTVDET